MKIPYALILKNMPHVEYHELIYQEGGFVPIKRLYPYIKGNWRIKVRVLKKSERRTWNNDRGQGQLMNCDMIDQAGSEVQGTFF
jgi:ssDNA-binding replication factor A large subunit